METRDFSSQNRGADGQQDVADAQSGDGANHDPSNGQATPIAPAWLRMINHAVGLSSATGARSEALATLIFELADFLTISGGSVYLYNPKRDLRHEASYGLSNRVARQVEETVQTEAARRLLTSQDTPVIVEDIRDVLTASTPNAVTASILDLLSQAGVVALASLPLVAQGNLLGFLALYHNLRRPYSKEEIEDLSLLASVLAMALMNRQLADTRKVEDKGRDQFISALSHELRTPLTSIIGFAQMIRRKLANNTPGDVRMAQQMEIIWTQAQRLNRLIDTFVDIANIEQGDFTLKFSQVEVVSVLKSAVEQTVARLNPTCEVEMKLPENLVWVRGDRQRLEQVFSNVISNALRYSPDNSPVVITCEEQESLGKVATSVSDRGPGISEDLRGAIFERFYQAEALRSGGLGVGLYLSKTIVEAHGGKIEVESERGAGTTISITLPV